MIREGGAACVGRRGPLIIRHIDAPLIGIGLVQGLEIAEARGDPIDSLEERMDANARG